MDFSQLTAQYAEVSATQDAQGMIIGLHIKDDKARDVYLQEMPFLQKVVLEGKKMKNVVLKNLPALRKVEFVLPNSLSLVQLEDLDKLENLQFRYFFQFPKPKLIKKLVIKNLPNLTDLNMEGSRGSFQEIVLDSLPNLNKLEVFVPKCKVLNLITELPRLEVLDIKNTGITQFDMLRQCPQVQILRVNAQVSENISALLCLKNLTVLEFGKAPHLMAHELIYDLVKQTRLQKIYINIKQIATPPPIWLMKAFVATNGKYLAAGVAHQSIEKDMPIPDFLEQIWDLLNSQDTSLKELAFQLAKGQDWEDGIVQEYARFVRLCRYNYF